MLNPDMKRVIEEQRLGFVATVGPDGLPNVSPKGTFIVLDDETIAFGHVRSPGTVRNLKFNPQVEVNFVDPFVRKGYRFAGTGRVVWRDGEDFERLIGCFQSSLKDRWSAIVTISITKALPLISPGYDKGQTEAEMRQSWTKWFRQMQPNGEFHE